MAKLRGWMGLVAAVVLVVIANFMKGLLRTVFFGLALVALAVTLYHFFTKR